MAEEQRWARPPRRRLREGRTDPDDSTSSRRRERRVNLRLSEAEFAELAAAAGKANVTVAGYAAKAALSTARAEMPPDIFEFAVQLFATRTQVAKVGTNLNQIAKVLNSGAAVPDERLAAVLADQRATLNTIGDLTSELIKVVRRHRRRRPGTA